MPDNTDRISIVPSNCAAALEALSLRVSSLEHSRDERNRAAEREIELPPFSARILPPYKEGEDDD